MTAEEAEKWAELNIKVLKTFMQNSVGYAQYRHDGTACVMDGTMYSPSDRVLPGASKVWREDSNPEAWEAFTEKMNEFIDSYEVVGDGNNTWHFGWEDGTLYAYSMDHQEAPDGDA